MDKLFLLCVDKNKVRNKQILEVSCEDFSVVFLDSFTSTNIPTKYSNIKLQTLAQIDKDTHY